VVNFINDVLIISIMKPFNIIEECEDTYGVCKVKDLDEMMDFGKKVQSIPNLSDRKGTKKFQIDMMCTYQYMTGRRGITIYNGDDTKRFIENASDIWLLKCSADQDCGLLIKRFGQKNSIVDYPFALDYVGMQPSVVSHIGSEITSKMVDDLFEKVDPYNFKVPSTFSRSVSKKVSEGVGIYFGKGYRVGKRNAPNHN